MLKILWNVFTLLTSRQKIEGGLMVVFMTFAAGLEIIGIGMTLPVILFFINPKIPEKSQWLEPLFRALSPGDMQLAFYYLCGSLAFIFVFKNSCLLLLIKLQTAFISKLNVMLSKKLFRNYLCAPYRFHLNSNSSILLRNLDDVEAICIGVLTPLMMLATELLIVTAIIAVLFYAFPLVTALAASLAFLAMALIYYPLRAWNYRLGSRARQYRIEELKASTQGLAGIKESIVCNSEDYCVESYISNRAQATRALEKLYVLGQIPRYAIEAGVVVFAMAALITLTYFKFDQEAIQVSVSLFAVCLIRLMPSLSRIQYQLSRIQQARKSFEVIFHDITKLMRSVKHQTQPEASCNAMLLHEAIELKHLFFAYEPGGTQILNDISLRIPRFSVVGIVGSTGCGKTTLIDLLLGLLEPDSGMISVDGRDIRENLSGWQNTIGYVPQFIYLLDDSVRANVAFGIRNEKIDDDRVSKCLQIAQLLDFVDALPQGKNTIIGERGTRLSGGQRQRLGIARALYRNPQILILDEATSALDHETETTFLDALTKLKGNLTILVIAHRKTTIDICDQIINIENDEDRSGTKSKQPD